MQLALANLLAFGTRKDDEKADQWLLQSGKTNADLQRHIRQVEIHETKYEPYYALIFEGHYKYVSQVSTPWSHRYQIADPRLLPRALVLYRNEIQGKKALQNQDLHSLSFLLGILGDIYMAYCLFDLAADSYREAAERDYGKYMRKGFLAKISDLSLISDQRQKAFVTPLAIALAAQGKEAEAIAALKSIKPLLNNPNGKDSFFLSRDFTENRNISARGLLTNLLLREERLDEVAHLDIVGDLKDCLNFRVAESKDITFCIENVWAFVKALVRSGNLTRAVDTLRHFSAVLEIAFGMSSPEVLVAKAELAFALSLRARLELDEALALQRRLISSFVLLENDPRSLLLQAQHAYALMKDNKGNDAIQCLENVMRIKKGLGEKHFISMGCMATLHNSLSFHAHSLLLIPFKIQQDIFELCKQVVHFDLQIDLMKFLCTFARLDGLEPAVIEIKSLVSLVARRRYNEPRERLLVQCHLSFMLLHWGFEYQNVERVEEAIGYLSDIRLPAAQTYGSTSPEYAYFARLLASAYGKKNALLCRFRGFGIQDINDLNYTVSVHQQMVETVRRIHGDLHIESIESLGELAVVLLDQGVVMEESARQIEAEKIMQQLSSYDDYFPSEQWMPILQAKRNLVALRLHLNQCQVSDLYDAQMEIVTWQSEHPDQMYPPAAASRMKDLAEVYVEHGSYNAAIQLFHNALSEQRRYLSSFIENPDRHPAVLCIHEALSSAYFSISELEQGFRGLAYVHTMSRVSFTDSERDFNVIRYSEYLSRGLCDQGCLADQGLRLRKEIYHTAQRILGEKHTRTISLAQRLATSLFSEGQRVEALKIAKTALKASMQLLGMGHSQTRHLWNDLKAGSGASPSNLATLEGEAEQLLTSIIPLKGKFSRENATDFQRGVACATRVALAINILGPDDLFTKEAIAALKQKCSNVFHLKDQGKSLLLRLHALSAGESRDSTNR